jgi:hypothetical protein
MMEKLFMLVADSEFAEQIQKALDNLEERNGKTTDTEELRSIINKTIELCQEIR